MLEPGTEIVVRIAVGFSGTRVGSCPTSWNLEWFVVQTVVFMALAEARRL